MVTRREFLALPLICMAGCNRLQAYQDASLEAFTADWCEVCQRDKPLLAEIAAEGFPVATFDADADREQVELYGIQAYPTYIVYDADRIERQRTGNLRRALKILRWLRSLR